MRHKRPSLGLMALAIALMTAAFVPGVAGALPSQGGGGPAAPPTSCPPKTSPPTTDRATNSFPHRN